MNIRIVTGPKTNAIGDIFTKASNHSAFGKVFLNNMDGNSFGNDLEGSTIEKQIALLISNSKTAIFHYNSKLSETQGYRNCEVS